MQNTHSKNKTKKKHKKKHEKNENPLDKTENSVRSLIAFASHTSPLPLHTHTVRIKHLMYYTINGKNVISNYRPEHKSMLS